MTAGHASTSPTSSALTPAPRLPTGQQPASRRLDQALNVGRGKTLVEVYEPVKCQTEARGARLQDDRRKHRQGQPRGPRTLLEAGFRERRQIRNAVHKFDRWMDITLVQKELET